MENYFVKMYTHPEVVHAVTRHIIDFYLEGNRRLYETAALLRYLPRLLIKPGPLR